LGAHLEELELTGGRKSNGTGNSLDNRITGNDQANVLTGRDGNDVLQGGLGADTLNGGLGADKLVYASAAESTGAGYDTIIGFDYSEDVVDLPGEVAGFQYVIDEGNVSISTATFDADLSAALNAAVAEGAQPLQPNQGIIIDPSGGDLADKIFLVIDGNGVEGYQKGGDFVFEVSQSPMPPTPTTDFFI
jgi:Ca2+-binding RTX toxin-like protein